MEMLYNSTRGGEKGITSSMAILKGIADDGGLFMPEAFPVMPAGMLEELIRADYQTRAVRIMKLFLEDFSEEELAYFASKAYAFGEKFDTEAVAPVHHVTEGTEVLELWHGPTCAFKDMALQMLPWLLTASLRKTGEEKTACILVATSGDTGKAALEGFRDVDHTKILVFYPKDGVSDIQKLQMVTQQGLTTRRPASSRSFPMKSCGTSWRRRGISCPLPTPSTGDASCRRWYITSALIAIWFRIIGFRWGIRSTSAFPPAISGISSLGFMPRLWAFP